MAQVIKKSGEAQELDENKLKASIMKAVIDAGAGVEEKKEMVEKISSEVIAEINQRGQMQSSEVKGKILEKLEQAFADASSAWKRFDAKYKN